MPRKTSQPGTPSRPRGAARPKPLPTANAPQTPLKPADLTNLETIGSKLKVYSLQNLLQAKRTFKTAPPAKLGDVLEPWFEKEVAKPGEKLEAVTEIWLAHVPAAISGHARLVSLLRGTLTVSVDSAPLRAQLDGLLRQSLLKTLQTLSKGAIFRVKTVVRAPIREVS